jgi:hypothetical protein
VLFEPFRELGVTDFGPLQFGFEEPHATAEIGHHHHVRGDYLLLYAQESSWREDNRRLSNGEQVSRLAGLAMRRGKSVDFSGYWQRHVAN